MRWVFAAFILLTTQAFAAPSTQPARTYYDSVSEAQKCLERTFLDAYKTQGAHDPKWDADVDVLLRNRAAGFAGVDISSTYHLKSTLEESKLVELADRIAATGCPDPLVAFCIASAHTSTGDAKTGGEMFIKAAKLLDDSKYPPLIKYLGLRSWVRRMDPKVDAQDLYDVSDRMDDLSLLFLTDGSTTHADADFIWRNLSSRFDDKSDIRRGTRYLAALKAKGNVDPWLLELAEGRFEIRLAWDARGNGWASSVTEEGWQKFREHMTNASKHLTAAWELDHTLPQAASAMITVCMGDASLSEVSAKEWFDRACSAQLDSEQAYDAYRQLLLPRWGGSYEELFAFGEEALASARFDTDLPWQYIRTLNQMGAELNGTYNPAWIPRIYNNVKTCCEGYIEYKESHGQSAGNSYATGFAYAYLAGDYANAARYKSKASEPDMRSATQKVRICYDDTPLVISAMTGTHGGEILEALSEPKNALESLKALQSKLPQGDESLPFISQSINEILFTTELSKGKWVSLLDDKSMERWHLTRGNWTRDESGALVCSGDDPMVIHFMPRLPHTFQVSCKMEVSGFAKDPGPRLAMLLWGDQGNHFAVGSSMKFHSATISNAANQGRAVPLDAQPQVSMDVTLVNGMRVLAVVNGVQIQQDFPDHAPGDLERRIGIQCNLEGGGGTIKVTELKIRQLTQ